MRSVSVARLFLFTLPLFLALGSAQGEEPAIPDAAFGTFQLGESTFEFTDAVAFQTTKLKWWPGQPVTVVVLTVEPITHQEVTSAVEESGDWFAPNHTRLILRFDSDGQLLGGVFLGYSAEAGSFQVAPDPAAIDAKAILSDWAVRGKAMMPEKATYSGKDYTFNVEFVAKVVATA